MWPVRPLRGPRTVLNTHAAAPYTGSGTAGGEACERQMQRGFRWLRFEPELEELYRQQVITQARRPVLVIVVAALTIWSVFAVFDFVRLDLYGRWPPAADIWVLLGARWVVMAKVSKTSNLIWLLTGQLINAATGEIVLDDSIELKGDPEPMIRAGVRNFAVRAAREVKQDGQAGGRTVGAHPSGARETLALELLRPSVIYTSDRSTRCLI